MSVNNSFNDVGCPYDTIVDLRYNLTTAEEYLYTPLEVIFITVVIPILLFVGTTGNLAFIYTVMTVKNMKTVTNTYLTYVALADILFSNISCVSYFLNYFLSHVRFDVPYRSFAGCMLTFHSVMATYFTSLFLITFVTIERYYAICQPLKHMMITGKKRTFKIILSSWSLSVVFGACVALRYSRLETFCIIWPDDELFTLLQTTIENCVSVHPDIFIFSEMIQTAPLFSISTCTAVSSSSLLVDAQTQPLRNKIMNHRRRLNV